MTEPRFNPEETTRPDMQRPNIELIQAAGKLPSATLHEAAGKIGALPAAIQPVAPDFKICGPAVTVHSPGGDNLWLHRAIYLAKPGDVLVVSVSDVYEHGYWGEIMSTAAKVRGLAGLVINGCVRDRRLLSLIGFPVFARGLCIRGTGKDFGARGWINAPTRFGEVTVNAGDLIVGDEDGVVCIPREDVSRAIAASEAREAAEADQLKRLKAGESTLSIFGWQ
ncbi:4-carboxy-4-hydroxy-2-oxoadipate aldolase/oxaloacetate decarboxylase [Paraburkholderia rhynchosiae]|uniref:Putative 4-hydroxy-4-methyl-2-oxoglutarate aldolase n=1 Tax=Paraburkholderia rhynchosiae TaxID=487049 RepID=A0A2N7WDQ2_9BURK|nr:4-carboxy-4-hydroxy-2-oxoadipate aldolase/oxaloacetate decarboxylase [Paraburkholderia rhynchosiae]PMS27491.1 4-hydroxy-4-methyl-2-oxoglutarate aldolase [Paraburkholderia rhynchosiae]CAB3723736.1 4-carboxy-4-hydroxy-2-oxoadipate aldolase [Paraburkholderia rhynchosiae]